MACWLSQVIKPKKINIQDLVRDLEDEARPTRKLDTARQSTFNLPYMRDYDVCSRYIVINLLWNILASFMINKEELWGHLFVASTS